ncbi:MAG: TrmH family RNA methyltransferase [Pyrinomonadaceae bacterium]
MRFERISSRDNARLKRVRKVRDGHLREEIFLEGLRLCGEAVRSDAAIEEIYVSDSLVEDRRFADLIGPVKDKHTVRVLGESLFASIADTPQPQGVVFICRRPTGAMDKIAARLASGRHLPIVVVLHRIGNPSNLGAIARTAEAAGAAGLITTTGSADPFSAKALRASMGSLLRLPTAAGSELQNLLEWARRREMSVSAADGHAEVTYVELDWSRPRLLIFGSEAHGLPEEILPQIDELVKVPMAAPVESLNIAVAAGVMLFEARRQVGPTGR